MNINAKLYKIIILKMAQKDHECGNIWHTNFKIVYKPNKTQVRLLRKMLVV